MTAAAHILRVLPDGDPAGPRPEPPPEPVLVGLVRDGRLHADTFTEFAAEMLQVIAYAVTVPLAFTEGFLRAYLAVEKVEEHDDGRVTIVPKPQASFQDMVRDVDELTARVDPGAVFNPVVRAGLDAAHQLSGGEMRWDLDTLSSMDDDQLMEVLRQMQAESEVAFEGDRDHASTDAVRARIATVRRNVRGFQARQHAQAGHGAPAPGDRPAEAAGS